MEITPKNVWRCARRVRPSYGCAAGWSPGDPSGAAARAGCGIWRRGSWRSCGGTHPAAMGVSGGSSRLADAPGSSGLLFAVPASRECGLTCELPADSMDGSGLLSMKNHELYPAYRFYVRMIKLWFLLFLPLSVGASCLSYRLSGSGKAAILTFGGCVFVVAVYGLLRNHFLRCPCCGKRSVTLRGESGCVLSTEWTLAPFEAYCRSCGKQMKTDLALKSNVFFKSIPTQVTAEQLEKLRHDTF